MRRARDKDERNDTTQQDKLVAVSIRGDLKDKSGHDMYDTKANKS